MFMFFWKPYNFVMFFIMMFGILLSVSAENWLMMWVGLEINLYSFIPLMLEEKKNQEKEAAIKYFISQSIPSALMVVSFINYNSMVGGFSFLLFFSLVMKMGMAPFHYWLPSVMNSISWSMCWVLSTIQKIVPMMLIFYSISFSSVMIMYSASLSSVIGGVGGLNQTMFRVLLAYSSIGHMGWILGASMSCKISAFFYFLSYLFIISMVFFIFYSMGVSSGNFLKKLNNSNILLLIMITIMFLSLGGVPPFLGFFPKMLVLVNLNESKFYFLSFFLILGSVMNLYYYLKVLFIMILNNLTSLNMIYSKTYKVYSMILGVGVMISSIFLVIILSVTLV